MYETPNSLCVRVESLKNKTYNFYMLLSKLLNLLNISACSVRF